MKRAAAQIKRLAYSNVAPVNSDINLSIRVPRKKKSSTGVLPNLKQHGEKTHKHRGAQLYWMLCKKSVMPEIKYILQSSEKCFVKRYNQQSIKEVLGGDLGNRADSVKHYNKYEHKW